MSDNIRHDFLSAGLAILSTPRRVPITDDRWPQWSSTLQLWPENDRCSFQFVDSKGGFIHSFEVLEFNASISVSNNTQNGFWRYATNNIWNGHFDNCLLQTQDGSFPIRNDTLIRTFGNGLLEEATLPYKICLCTSSLDGKNLSSWACQRNRTVSSYPGHANLYVTLIGDFNRTVSGKVTVVTAAEELSYEITDCTLIPLYKWTQPGESERIHLQLALYNGVLPIWSLEHTVWVKIIDCPAGLAPENTGCSCNNVLKEHSFICSVTSSHFTYKATTHSMWIGNYGEGNGSLAISVHCPSFYCSNFIFQNGILLDDVNNRNSVSNRELG